MSTTRRNLYLLLGLPEGSDCVDVKKQYLKLMNLFFAQEESGDIRLQRRIRFARERLSQAYERFKTGGARSAYNGDFARPTFGHRSVQPASRPKIGQLLVASGVITLEELDEALEGQRMSHPVIPIGRLLVSWMYLTEEELDEYLKLQELITLLPDDPVRLASQLLELGLISEDQLAIARLDQRTKGLTLADSVVKRGWLNAKIVETLPYSSTAITLRTAAWGFYTGSSAAG